MDREFLSTVLSIVVNIAAVVAIVSVNKKIYDSVEEGGLGFPFPNALMAIHFYCTVIGIVIYQKMGGFELPEQKPPFRNLLLIALYQIGSVMFVNFSLLYNSVGMYQILKLANIPVLCVIEFYLRGISYSTKVKLALAVLLVGIGITAVTEIRFSWLGFIHGMIATVTTAAYQISVKDLSKGLSSQQSCYYVTPISALLFTLAVPFTDNLEKLSMVEPTNHFLLGVVLISGVIAFAINLTVFIIVGKTSPVTYQVVGHVKTTLTLISGFVFFQAPLDIRNISGMLLAMVGVIWYTNLKMTEQNTAKKVADEQKVEQVVVCKDESDLRERS